MVSDSPTPSRRGRRPGTSVTRQTVLSAARACFAREGCAGATIRKIAALRRGHRIRVDVQPYDGVAHGMLHAHDAAAHDGEFNSVHTGPGRLGYLQLPLLPARVS